MVLAFFRRKKLFYVVVTFLIFCIFYELFFLSREKNTNFLLSTGKNDAKNQIFRQFGGDGDFYIYSAYFNQKLSAIDIIGLVKIDLIRNNNEAITSSIFCSVFYDDSTKTNHQSNLLLLKSPVSIYPIEERNRSVIFMAVILTCNFFNKNYLPNNNNPKKKIILRLFRTHEIWLDFPLSIQSNINPKNQQLFRLARCAPIFYGNQYTDNNQLAKILSINSRLGIEYFQIYAHSNIYAELISNLSIDKIDNHDFKIFATDFHYVIREWNLPVNPFEIWYYGQLIMLQDCLYSLRSMAKFLFVGDLDEYLIAKVPIDELLSDKYYDNVFSGNLATIKAKNCRSTQQALSAESAVRPNWRLTKYLVRLDRARALGVHRALSSLENKSWTQEFKKNPYAVKNITEDRAVVVHCKNRVN